MKWYDLFRELEAQTDTANLAIEAQKENSPFSIQELLEAEPLERRKIDAACQHFAAHGNWPNLTQLQATLAYVRLAHAALFAEMLAQSSIFDNHDLDSPAPTILEFLLVDLWQEWGRKRWISS